MRLAIWLLERFLEVVAATAVLMIVARPSRVVAHGSLVEEVIRTANIPLAFYLYTGYLISCVVFGLLLRDTVKDFLFITMGVAFSIHYMGFLLLTGADYDEVVVIAGLLSLVAVVGIHWLTVRLFSRIRTRSSSK